MNIYEAEAFFNNIYGGNVSFDLDAMCYRDFGISFTDGIPDASQFITYGKLKVTPNAQSAFYFPIDPQREEVSFADMKTLIEAMN